MKKTFNISTIDSLSFAGPKDQNIKLIENSFKSKIVVRGDDVMIEGTKNEIDILNILITCTPPYKNSVISRHEGTSYIRRWI